MRYFKIFLISFFSLIGVFALGTGIMYLAGTFSTPEVKPENISFEFGEYNIDGDFVAKVITTTEGVNNLDITLTLSSNNTYITTEGLLSDGVISIPKSVKIGEEFKVKAVKKVRDSEAGGQDWVKGGHSEIIATSSNLLIETTKTKVNVDVPVYSISLKTYGGNDYTLDKSKFVVGADIFTKASFSPARSQYKYSSDGANGYDKNYKNVYYIPTSSTQEQLLQDVRSNKFKCLAIGNNIGISAYVYKTANEENRVLKNLNSQNLTDEAKYLSILNDLKEKSDDTLAIRLSEKSTCSVDIVNIKVDTMTATGTINNLNTNVKTRLFLNNASKLKNEESLDLILSSSIDGNVNLEKFLTDVAISFQVKVSDNVYEDATKNNSIKIIDNLSSTTIDSIKYFYPTIVNNSLNLNYIDFVCLSPSTSYRINIAFIPKDGSTTEVKSVSKNFNAANVVSSPVSWINAYENGINLAVIDDIDPSKIIYEEFDLTNNINVPSNNQYLTSKYFAYCDNLTEGQNLSDYIITKDTDAKLYTGINKKLYELENGIIKGKLTADNKVFDKEFNVIFATVKTDYNGKILLNEDGTYIVDQFAQTKIGTYSSMSVRLTKTIKGLSGNIEINEESIIAHEEEKGLNDTIAINRISIVQGILDAFDVVISLELPEDKDAFVAAVNSGNIQVVAKSGGTVSNVITCSANNVSTAIGDLTDPFKFTMQVNNLSGDDSAIFLKIYIVYNKTQSISQSIEVATYSKFSAIEDKYIDAGLFDIEVYDGKATKFNFAFNIPSPDKEFLVANSEYNPIVASLTPEALGDANFITSIKRSYLSKKIEGAEEKDVDVTPYVFEESGSEGVYTSKMLLELKDRYDKIPLNSDYTLESSDNSIISINDKNSIQFINTSDTKVVAIYLKDSNDEIKDVLYFMSKSAGKVVHAEQLKQDWNVNQINNTKTELFKDNAEGNLIYSFPNTTVRVLGIAGNKIHFNLKGDIGNRLITYKFKNSADNNANAQFLDNLMTYSIINELPKGVLKDGIENNLNQPKDFLLITQDFGKTAIINIQVSIVELGIKQNISLEIVPNISSDLIPEYHAGAVDQRVGVTTYKGVFSSDMLLVNVTLTKQTNLDTEVADPSEYGFTFSDATLIKEVFILNEKDKKTIKPGSDIQITKTFCIVFKEVNNFTTLSIKFGKTTDAGTYDINENIYVNINPNVKINNVHTAIQTMTGNGIDLSGLITLSRISASETTIDKTKISYSIYSSTDSNGRVYLENDINNPFTIDANGYLKIKNGYTFNDLYTLQIKVFYNGYNVAIGANTSLDAGFTITLKVLPDIFATANLANTVIYDGQESLFLKPKENGYTSTEILATFTNGYSFKFNEIPSSYPLVYANDVYTVDYTGKSLKLFSGELKITVKDTNGNSRTFNVVIMPVGKDVVGYDDKDAINTDLKILLDKTLLASKDIYLHCKTNEPIDLKKSTDNIAGFSEEVIGQANTIFTVINQDLSDSFEYANVSYDKIAKTLALNIKDVGKDVYLYVIATLGSNGLEIPLRIKISKNVEIVAYYPYLNGVSKNKFPVTTEEQEKLETDIKSANCPLDMEYLSFENKSASVYFGNYGSSYVPNKSKLDKKYGFYDTVGEGSEKDESYNPIVNLTVDSVYVVNSLASWQKTEYKDKYASFGTLTSTKNILSITQNEAISLRIKVKIQTESGATLFYYISVGEIKNSDYIVKQKINNIFTQDIEAERELIEGNSYKNFVSDYKLSQMINNIEKDQTLELLRFSIEDFDAFFEKTANDYIVKPVVTDVNKIMLLYSKYGQLKVVTIKIKCPYSPQIDGVVLAKDNNNNYVYETYSASNFDAADKIKIINLAGGNEPVASISNITKDDSQNANVKIEGNIIKFAPVETKTLIKINFEYAIEANGEVMGTYTYSLIFTLLPALKNLETGTSYARPVVVMNGDNPLEITGGKNSGFALSQLFSYGDKDNSLLDYALLSNVDFISVVSSSSIIDIVYDKSTGQMNITTNFVTEKTVVVFEVRAVTNLLGVNEGNVVIKAYVQITILPTYSVNLSYPKANSDQVTDGEYIWARATNDSTGDIDGYSFGLNNIAPLAGNPRVTVTDYSDKNIIISSDVKFKVSTNFNIVYVNVDGITLTADSAENKAGFDLGSVITIKLYSSTSQNTNVNFVIYVAGVQHSIYTIVACSESPYHITGNNFNASSSTNNSASPETVFVSSLEQNNFFKSGVLKATIHNFEIPDNEAIGINGHIELKLFDGINNYSKDNAGVSISAKISTIITKNQVLYWKTEGAETPNLFDIIIDDAKLDTIKTYSKPTFIAVVTKADDDNVVVAYIKQEQLVVNTRLNVEYNNYSLDFITLYSYALKNISDATFNSTGLQSFEIKISDGNDQTVSKSNYYVNYSFDVQAFGNTKETAINIEANVEPVSFLKALNVKHLNGSLYGAGNFINSNLFLSCINKNGEAGEEFDNSKNFMTYEYVNKNINNKNTVVDIMFKPNGAVNAGNYVAFTIIIKAGEGEGSLSMQGTVYFFITADYNPIQKYNTNGGTINTSASRLIIPFDPKNPTLTIATKDNPYNINESNNLIIVTHRNMNEPINYALVFSGSVSSGGGQGSVWATNPYLSEDKNSLKISFTTPTFGNKNIDITFSDIYGYTFTYYITLIAKEQVDPQMDYYSFYEKTSINLVSKDDQRTNNVIKILGLSSFEGVSINYSFITTDANGIMRTYNELSSSLYKLSTFFTINEENRGNFSINLIDPIFFQNSNSKTGTLRITLTKNSSGLQESANIEVTFTINKKYSVTISSEDIYVRDGKPVNLVDIFTVKDNEKGINIGERTLVNAKSLIVLGTDKFDPNQVGSIFAIKATKKSNHANYEYYIVEQKLSKSYRGVFIINYDIFPSIINTDDYEYSIVTVDDEGKVLGTPVAGITCQIVDDVLLRVAKTVMGDPIKGFTDIPFKLKNGDNFSEIIVTFNSSVIEYISLTKKGLDINSKLFTGKFSTDAGTYTYYSGVESDTLAEMKNLKIEDIEGNNLIENNSITFNLSVTSDKLVYNQADKLYYEAKEQSFKISTYYDGTPISNNEKKTFFIIPSYTGVDTSEAYKSGNVKIVIKEVKPGTSIALSEWGSEFHLIAGKGSVYENAKATENLDFFYKEGETFTKTANISFSLTTANQNAKIDVDGKIDILTGFTAGQHISINVNYTYNPPSGVSQQVKIGEIYITFSEYLPSGIVPIITKVLPNGLIYADAKENNRDEVKKVFALVDAYGITKRLTDVINVAISEQGIHIDENGAVVNEGDSPYYRYTVTFTRGEGKPNINYDVNIKVIGTDISSISINNSTVLELNSREINKETKKIAESAIFNQIRVRTIYDFPNEVKSLTEYNTNSSKIDVVVNNFVGTEFIENSTISFNVGGLTVGPIEENAINVRIFNDRITAADIIYLSNALPSITKTYTLDYDYWNNLGAEMLVYNSLSSTTYKTKGYMEYVCNNYNFDLADISVEAYEVNDLGQDGSKQTIINQGVNKIGITVSEYFNHANGLNIYIKHTSTGTILLKLHMASPEISIKVPFSEIKNDKNENLSDMIAGKTLADNSDDVTSSDKYFYEFAFTDSTGIYSYLNINSNNNNIIISEITVDGIKQKYLIYKYINVFEDITLNFTLHTFDITKKETTFSYVFKKVDKVGTIPTISEILLSATKLALTATVKDENGNIVLDAKNIILNQNYITEVYSADGKTLMTGYTFDILTGNIKNGNTIISDNNIYSVNIFKNFKYDIIKYLGKKQVTVDGVETTVDNTLTESTIDKLIQIASVYVQA